MNSSPKRWVYSTKVAGSVKKRKHSFLIKQNSLKLSSISPSKDRIRSTITNKESIQTILCNKSSYVERLNLSTTSWCLYDSKKCRYFGFRERYQREVASLTKIMTAIVSIQFIKKHQIPKDLLVRVTESSVKLIGTTAELKEKTWVRLWDLLYGAMLPSGNDAANLLSQVIGFYNKNLLQLPKFNEQNNFLDLTADNTNMYTVEFVKLMNRKAYALDLIYSKFSNPHGLQNAFNTSTPRDMIQLSVYASLNEDFTQIMNTITHQYEFYQEIPSTQKSSIEEKLHSAKKKKKSWQNTNVLLKKDWQGIKTGQTSAAGGCLASLKNGIYIVVLNCKNNEMRFTETEKIYQWYSESYGTSTDDSEEDYML